MAVNPNMPVLIFYDYKTMISSLHFARSSSASPMWMRPEMERGRLYMMRNKPYQLVISDWNMEPI